VRWRLSLSHGVNQEIHSMAIISQDAIKLGCSGGQSKIQIQTYAIGIITGFSFICAKQYNIRDTLHASRDTNFLQNKPNFGGAQMSTSIYEQKDCEKMKNASDFRKTNPIKANIGSLSNLSPRDLFDHIEILVSKTKLRILILQDRLDILLTK